MPRAKPKPAVPPPSADGDAADADGNGSAGNESTGNGSTNDGSVTRRAPFASNPFVGERGQRAQARLLEAALEVFGEVGYHGCGVKAITERSELSRASFYQYFSSKEDLFRHLAGRVARELAANVEQLEPVTDDAAGHAALLGWFTRFSEVYEAYRPVFATFQAAAMSDTEVATGSARIASRTFDGIRSRIVTRDTKRRDRAVRAMLETVHRANFMADLLDSSKPTAGAFTRDELNLAMADVFHRLLFGYEPAVNVHDSPRSRRRARAVPLSIVEPKLEADTLGPAAHKTQTLLLDTGKAVFAERGYYATRVTDVVKAADVSHGVFYRYFDNKTHLFQLLAQRASEHMIEAFADLPDLSGTVEQSDLVAWLRQYADAYASETTIITMWREAMSLDPAMAGLSAAAVEGPRAPVAAHLDERGFGNPDAEAVLFIVFLDVMTAGTITKARLDDTAALIHAGLVSTSH